MEEQDDLVNLINLDSDLFVYDATGSNYSQHQDFYLHPDSANASITDHSVSYWRKWNLENQIPDTCLVSSSDGNNLASTTLTWGSDTLPYPNHLTQSNLQIAEFPVDSYPGNLFKDGSPNQGGSFGFIGPISKDFAPYADPYSTYPELTRTHFSKAFQNETLFSNTDQDPYKSSGLPDTTLAVCSFPVEHDSWPTSESADTKLTEYIYPTVATAATNNPAMVLDPYVSRNQNSGAPRKRKQQLLETNSTNPAVPGSLVFTATGTTTPAAKRSKFQPERRKEVAKIRAQGACMRCKILKLAVSLEICCTIVSAKQMIPVLTFATLHVLPEDSHCLSRQRAKVPVDALPSMFLERSRCFRDG
ncbi:hypothetical protein ACLMJK_001145 [Lecanora helva]